MKKTNKQITEAFILAPDRTSWVKYPRVGPVFLRKARQGFKGSLLYCFDIANVSIPNPKNCGKGFFKEWLAEIMPAVEASEVFEAIRIENVLTERFANYFRGLGWVEVKSEDELTSTFFKIL